MSKRSFSILVTRQLERKCFTLLTSSDPVEGSDGRTDIFTKGECGGQLRGQSPPQRLQRVPSVSSGRRWRCFPAQSQRPNPRKPETKGQVGGALISPSAHTLQPRDQPILPAEASCLLLLYTLGCHLPITLESGLFI